ncbi:YqaA family protein [Motiliproteus sp. MSK22-1]|uniref:YqaA family protein n=1 Tax=Motiliproteus sp. MSK22-1 TaxID=1897630 RepID=UPI000976C9C3|nr:YqaA family protein [Motiliproteus sp. MSK22-1]OMH25600.1 hypothetical protein BGP75_23920 [Motiliproteus sp. MSK22-1]
MIEDFLVRNELGSWIDLFHWGDSELWILFGSGFIASTLLPGGSELYLGFLIAKGEHPFWLPVMVATAGNTLGGLLTWGMGYGVSHYFPLKQLSPRQSQARNWLQSRGYPALLLSWLPVIGDPLCMLSGWLKMNFWCCALLILVGKASRYFLVSVGVSLY